RPAGRLGDGAQEHREREHGSGGDAGHEGAQRDHDPAVPWFFHFASAAALRAAISIFLILSIASMTRFAFFLSGPERSLMRICGAPCHDRPYLSLSQPHIDSSPPFESLFQ